MLVEDDADTQLIYFAVLEDAGFRVSIASDGEEALQKASGERIDLVVMDIVIPKLGG